MGAQEQPDRMTPPQAARLLGVPYSTLSAALRKAGVGAGRTQKTLYVTLGECRAALEASSRYTRSWGMTPVRW